MEIINNLSLGISTAFTWTNILYCFVGTFLGTLVGVLPGLSPLTAVAILLPLVYSIGDPVTALILLSGIYYGSQYGGSTTSILLKIPAEAPSLVTAIDGYAMTRNGRGGAALTIAALASFFAGTITTLLIAIFAEPLAQIAFAFGSAEYTSLMVMGLLASVAITNGPFLRGVGMVLIGILLGTVGIDINTGIERFTFGSLTLRDGINFAIIAVGVFGFGEMIYNLFHGQKISAQIPKFKDLYPTKKEFRDSVGPAARGTLIGSLLGILPGGGALLSSFGSYVVEKKLSKDKKSFGKGNIAGVAGPEAANNAGAQISFIPMLSLGIPTTPIMALMIASLMIFSIQPGPEVVNSNPSLFWGLVVSMWLGNLMLVILNIPLVGVWVSVLRIPQVVLFSIIFCICVFGIYVMNNNISEVWLLLPFAVLGYIFRRLDCETAPLAMGFVIGLLFEEYFRKAMMISKGDWMIFLQSPISATFLLISLVVIAISIIFKIKK